MTVPVEVQLDRSQEPTIHIIQPSPSRSTSEMNSPKDDESDDDDSSNVSEGAYLKSKLWWLGLALMSIGECGNFLSYGYANSSVVAPLGTVVSRWIAQEAYVQALIANCIFAPLILKERFKLKDLVGVGLAILGAVTVVWSSSDSNPRVSRLQSRLA
jgi:drug/metabolite transporter (DMT)-like permease